MQEAWHTKPINNICIILFIFAEQQGSVQCRSFSTMRSEKLDRKKNYLDQIRKHLL